MLDYVEDEYSYDHHTKYPNSSKEIDYTPSKTINRNGEMEQPGFYATQNEENNLHNNMPMYTGYLSDELEEELNYQNLRYGQVYLFKLFYHKCIFITANRLRYYHAFFSIFQPSSICFT